MAGRLRASQLALLGLLWELECVDAVELEDPEPMDDDGVIVSDDVGVSVSSIPCLGCDGVLLEYKCTAARFFMRGARTIPIGGDDCGGEDAAFHILSHECASQGQRSSDGRAMSTRQIGVPTDRPGHARYRLACCVQCTEDHRGVYKRVCMYSNVTRGRFYC